MSERLAVRSRLIAGDELDDAIALRTALARGGLVVAHAPAECDPATLAAEPIARAGATRHAPAGSVEVHYGAARVADPVIARPAFVARRAERWPAGLAAAGRVWLGWEADREAAIAAGADPGRLEVLERPVDASAFGPATEPVRLPDARRTVVVAPVEWTSRGGWDLVLSAWITAVEADDDATLLLVASSPHGRSLEEMHADAAALIGRLGRDPDRVADVTLLPRPWGPTHLAGLYAGADAVVWAARGGPGLASPAEALATGTPVVAPDSGHWTASVDSTCGWPIPVRTVPVTPAARLETPTAQGVWEEPVGTALAEALHEVVHDGEGRARRGRGARARSLGHPAGVPERLLDAVAQMAESGRRARSTRSAQHATASAGATGGLPARYPVPLRDPADGGRPPDRTGSAPARVRHEGRRLAVLDTHFPWRLSGFRFHEFAAIAERRPDTAFFSLFEMTDPFASPVFALADFPRRAPELGITDVYLVFLNFAVGVLGLAHDPVARGCGGVRPDISLLPEIDALGLDVHLTLYPGGGLTPDTSPELLRAVAARCTTVFTNLPEVRDAVPGAIFSHAVTATRLYAPAHRSPREDLHVVFASDDRPRKGLRTLLDAFALLPSGFRLTVVGPHEARADEIAALGGRQLGWLAPETLAQVYADADVFVSPVTREADDFEAGERRLADGFPTSCAVDAMATGCLCITSNPRRDVHLVRPGVEYLEIPERDPAHLADALLMLREERALLAEVAERGTDRVRSEMSVEAGVRRKLAAMGLAPAP